MKHLFIVNPTAGGRKKKTEAALLEIKNFAKFIGGRAEVYTTRAPMDACRKIKEEADMLRAEDAALKTLAGSSAKSAAPAGALKLLVYACGGDGTLNECVNGAALNSDIAVTHFPCGTGNDFLKTFSPENVVRFRDLNALSRGVVTRLDIIECTSNITSSGKQGSRVKASASASMIGAARGLGIRSGALNKSVRYGLNICSVGIDARVGTDVHKYSGLPLIGGATGYITSLVVNVIKGVTQKVCVTADDLMAGSITIDKKLTLTCVCNGRYYGGGFNPVPDAMPDDGILDCLVVEPVSRLDVASIVSRYAAGRFREFPEIFRHIRCTDISISAERDFVISVDGERIVTDKVSFKVIPKGVNFVYPKGLK